MSAHATEIYRCYDDWGMIRVLDDGVYRYLAFGDGGEQSCVQLNDNSRLIHEYSQAMLLALLYYPQPQTATVIGVGAGSLVNALSRYDAKMQITAVELRADVVDVARQWFDFQPSRQVNIEVADAASFLYQTTSTTDLLLIDIYDDEGMDESLLDEDFFADCYRHLSPQGILVINLWEQGNGGHPQAYALTRRVFGQNLLVCPIKDGNLVLFAFKGGAPETNPRRLQQAIRRLAERTGIRAGQMSQQLRRP